MNCLYKLNVNYLSNLNYMENSKQEQAALTREQKAKWMLKIKAAIALNKRLKEKEKTDELKKLKN